MQNRHHFPLVLFLAALALSLDYFVTPVSGQSGGALTLQIGSPPAPPITLVSHGEEWRYRRGTSEPPSDWRTVADAALDGTWLTGAGGFGYGDAGIEGEATTLSGMTGVHSTLYIRRTFTIVSPPDTNAPLELVVDYDDGFVAYLDGVEIARANLTNGPGSFVAYNATTGGRSHEASCCQAPLHPAETFPLGAAGNRLAVGTHVLALIGVNQARTSSDFHLIPDLLVGGAPASVVNGSLLTIVKTNLVELSGLSTAAGSAGVVVNGATAAFAPASGAWSRTEPLQPGMNRLFMAALDANGNILAATNRLIVSELGSTAVGGTLTENTAWTSTMGIIRVTTDVVVPGGITLSIGDGVVVLLNPGVSIRATAGGTIDVAGTETRPTFFLPADGASNWGAINATGAGASVTARHIETAAGAITFNSGANGVVEDSFLHDRGSILTANGAGLIVTRRLHVKNYEETIYNSGTSVLAEDSLYEDLRIPNSDCLEIQGGPPGSVVRRCTFRNATGDNSDAVDFNGTSGARVESCLIHNITDKAISLGASGTGGAADFGIVISNCLIYRVDTGLAIKDSSTASLYDTTIAASSVGIRSYQKFSTPIGGGHVTNGFNNIVWGNTTGLQLSNGGTVTTEYSDIQGLVWPGTGNISDDPLFVNALAGDFRLGEGSPATGTGRDGANMGFESPVGGLPPAPMHLAAHAVGTNVIRLWWLDDADNEDGFAVERSSEKSSWQLLGGAGANVTNFTDPSAMIDQRYFYRVRATNASGSSHFSNIAGAIRQVPTMIVGGTLTADTVWAPELGTVHVVATVTVPTNVTLTIQAGTVVKLTNGVSLIAETGGVIRIEGTWDHRVILERWNGDNNWGELRAGGTNSRLEVRFADISGGQTTVYHGAAALVEDSEFHDFIQQGPTTTFNQPLFLTHYAAPSTVRRCHFHNYYETLWRHGLNTIEDCVFEESVGDALDFDAALPGSVIRRCTFRHGTRGNVDAIDIGNDGPSVSVGNVIESCLMFDFPFDKGVSIGETARDIVVTNCLIYLCNWGIGVKDSSTVGLYNNTIAKCDAGFRLYHKTDPGSGLVTNSFNNILWGNTNGSIVVLDGGSIAAHHSDVQGTNWPGTGNIDADPLFVDFAQDDYRLQPDSPCLGTGLNGANMGVTFPVGAFIQAPDGLVAVGGLGSVALAWRDQSPSEAVFEIERSTDGAPFTVLARVPLDTTNYVDAEVLVGHSYGYRVRGLNITTNSEYSASAVATVGARPILVLGAGGTGFDANGHFSLQFVAPAGITTVIEASTNLHDWVPLGTNGTDHGQVEFVDPGSTKLPWRFYRALLKP